MDENTLYVEYDYADGGAGGVAKYVRLVDIVYPNGRTIDYGYGTAGGADDIMSRTETISTAGEEDPSAVYTYLGASMIVTEDYAQAERQARLHGHRQLLLRLRPLWPHRRSGLGAVRQQSVGVG